MKILSSRAKKIIFGTDFSNWSDFIKFLIKAILAVTLFKSLLFANYQIPSSSMVPTLLTGDRIIVNKYYYGYSKYSLPFKIIPFSGKILQKRFPKYGDVVVFAGMKNDDILYIKRVIGLPGDEIEIKNGNIYINQKQLSQKITLQDIPPSVDLNENSFVVDMFQEQNLNNNIYPINIGSRKSIANNVGKFIVPEDYYFCMGDNRDNSHDSRFNTFGMIHNDHIIGKAMFVYLSGRDNMFKFWNWLNSVRFNRFFYSLVPITINE